MTRSLKMAARDFPLCFAVSHTMDPADDTLSDAICRVETSSNGALKIETLFSYNVAGVPPMAPRTATR